MTGKELGSGEERGLCVPRRLFRTNRRRRQTAPSSPLLRPSVLW